MDTALGAVIAGVFALLGVYLAQRHERALSNREERRQQTAWARDDAARSYEHRRESYLQFSQQWRRHFDLAFRYREWDWQGPDLDYDWMDRLYDAFVQLQIFGTRPAVQAAEAAMSNLNEYAMSGKEIDYSLYEAVQQEIRRDLAIPDEPSSLPTGHVESPRSEP